MKKTEELVVITKTYDLILWSCNHTGRFGSLVVSLVRLVKSIQRRPRVFDRSDSCE